MHLIMKLQFKYGFLSAAGYTFVIAILVGIFQGINSLTGTHDLGRYANLPYILAATSGFIIAFLAGFCFQPILKRMIAKLSDEYPAIPAEDMYHLCREKLLMTYFLILTCISLISVLGIISVIDSYPELACTLFSAGFTFAVLYLQCRNRYKHLYRHYRIHYNLKFR